MHGSFSNRLEVQTQAKFNKISKNSEGNFINSFKTIFTQLLDNWSSNFFCNLVSFCTLDSTIHMLSNSISCNQLF
jgi:hypothetical protein